MVNIKEKILTDYGRYQSSRIKKNSKQNAFKKGGARGVMVIVVGNEHSETSWNPGRDWLHFTYP